MRARRRFTCVGESRCGQVALAYAVVLLIGPVSLALGDDTRSGRAWVDRTPPGPAPRSGHTMFYDSARGVMVLFGGVEDQYFNRETWEWDGVAWARCSRQAPNGRGGHAAAYDSANGVGVLFGGTPALDRTWEFDGQSCTWTSRSTGTSPNPHMNRNGAAMAFHEQRGVTVMFGGQGPFGFFDATTWGYDAEVHDWCELADPDGAPSPRSGHAMAYDSARARTVLFAGNTAGGLNGETWEWDGDEWHLVGQSGPAARYKHVMAYDGTRGVVVLFGGYDANGWNGETWEWDGTGWALRTSGGPTPRSSSAMAYDDDYGVVVLFGGRDAGGPIAETWEWDGNAWTQRTPDWPPVPSPRAGHAMAYDLDRARVVLFGGTNSVPVVGDTWEWDGANLAWCFRTGEGAPSRSGHAMAYDAGRGETVLFGGWVSVNRRSDETWAWDGSAWAQRSPVHKPSARCSHALTYDSRRAVLVLFGGATGSPFDPVLSNETWEWDGHDWTQRYPRVSPSARSGHATAYNPTTGVTVLFGGKDANGLKGDTWFWTGGPTWLSMPVCGPSPRSGHSLVYDSKRQVMVLFGGTDADGANGQTWLWRGSAWTLLTQDGPAPHKGHAMVYDQERQTAVLFGGISGGSYGRETWEWGAPCISAEAVGRAARVGR